MILGQHVMKEEKNELNLKNAMRVTSFVMP